MKKQDILSLLYQFAAPVGVILIGGLLVVNPDFVSIFVSRVMGGAANLAGICFLVAAIFGRENRIKKIIGWLICSATGSWLLASPLVPAAFAGRILGILLTIRGFQNLRDSSHNGGKVLSLALTAAGVVLILLPMTASRLVFAGCGVVIVIVGVVMFLDRWKDRRYLNRGRDDIIDAL